MSVVPDVRPQHAGTSLNRAARKAALFFAELSEAG